MPILQVLPVGKGNTVDILSTTDYGGKSSHLLEDPSYGRLAINVI
jgi:hypothetical protein